MPLATKANANGTRRDPTLAPLHGGGPLLAAFPYRIAPLIMPGASPDQQTANQPSDSHHAVSCHRYIEGFTHCPSRERSLLKLRGPKPDLRLGTAQSIP